MTHLQVIGENSVSAIDFVPRTLIIAGWTGRDTDGLEAHIRELEALGIARPKAVPMFYRVAASLLTTAPSVQMVSCDGSGEVESVLIKHEGEWFIGVGSDHTDRVLEAIGITLSKQACSKPISSQVWKWHDIEPHWDRVVLRSQLPDTDEVYQEGEAAALRRPDDLLALYESREGPVEDGTVMFCGTLPVHGGIRFAPSMLLEMIDPVLGRSLSHHYAVDVLPVAEA